ncbi:S24 family peptidase [Oceanimonas baumannii]|uniref:S24 family peptidase n=1 Tax=Oceanimonas baumannii TaxID=129578 RepID=UPI001D19272C|nr:S24 family peptidase [Oceanimonas baumannii]MCC4262979.1 S24 family peptidase [Oceanimonas baumannii]
MGCFYKWDHLEARVPFSTAWLEDHGLAGKRLAVLKVQGDSMSPTLEDGDTPLVEILPEDAVENLPDSVYVLRLNGQLLIKRLQSGQDHEKPLRGKAFSGVKMKTLAATFYTGTRVF